MEEEYVDHFSQKPVLVDLIILGMGSFQMSLSRTEVYRSSRYLTTYGKYHQTDFPVPSNVPGTFLHSNVNVNVNVKKATGDAM